MDVALDTVFEQSTELGMRLAALARRGTELRASCLCISALRAHGLKSFDTLQPLLVFPLLGQLRARYAGRCLEVEAGQVLLVSGPATLDVEKIPDARAGAYVAIGTSLDGRVIDAARRLLPEHRHNGEVEVMAVPVGDLSSPMQDWCAAIETGDETMALHALLGAVLRLHARGHFSLLALRTPTLSAQVRALVAAAPARAWVSVDIELALGLSGATLRRRLAAEGANLRDVIARARMAHALDLLYTTRLPIKTVALRSGYASPSTFSRRFEQRYGLEPSRVGGR